MEYTDEDADRKRKIKIVAITCVLAVAILGIGAFVTISAISSIGTTNQVANTINAVTPANDTKSSSATTEQKSESATEQKSETNTEKTESAKDSSSKKSSESNKKSAASSSDDIPTTGPESIIPAAVLMGIATYLVLLNRNLIKNNAEK